MTVALYARISRDPHEQRIGVAHQLERLTAYAAHQWPDQPTVAWDDNDLSAADPDVDRPGYAAMLDAIRTGGITAIVAVEQSRLTRQPAQWEELCLTLTRAGITEVHTLNGGVVSVAPAMRLLGRVMAAVDAEEVERTRARTRAAHARLRAEGRPAGGRPYGYRNTVDERGRATLEIVPDQADVIRTAARMLLDGWTLAAIAEHLNTTGAPTPRGGTRWRRTTLSSILSREAIAGYRDGAPATWPAILDQATWARLEQWRQMPTHWRTRNGTPATATKARRPAHDYLLAGLAHCGVCGWPLRGNQQARRDGSTVPSYQCKRVNNEPRAADGGPCGGVSITAHLVDPDIEADVLTLASDPAVVAALTTVDTGARARHEAALAAAEAQLAEIAALWGAGELTAGEWHAARTAARTRAHSARTALAGLPAGDGLDVADVAARWGTASIGHRRRVTALFVARVDVWPAHHPDNARLRDGRRWTVAPRA